MAGTFWERYIIQTRTKKYIPVIMNTSKCNRFFPCTENYINFNGKKICRAYSEKSLYFTMVCTCFLLCQQMEILPVHFHWSYTRSKQWEYSQNFYKSLQLNLLHNWLWVCLFLQFLVLRTSRKKFIKWELQVLITILQKDKIYLDTYL